MSDERMGLAGTLALLAATVAMLFGVALTRDNGVRTALEDSGTQAPAAKLDSDELLDLSVKLSPAVARRVEEIRGLEFDEVPKPQVTDSEELRELAKKQIEKSKAAETVAASDAALKLLGLLEPDDSLAELATETSANAAAYYDPKEKELFLLGDAVPASAGLAEFILAHELDHALEDQAFGLPKSSPSSDDRVLAESALIEGSATALMTEYALRHIAFTDLLDETGGLDSDATDLPDIVMAQIMFTYFGGQYFVDELRDAAEGGWDLVDFAYQRRLPATTEQILHPEKYLDDEGPLPVPGLPEPGPEWEQADAGTIGEFFTREILRQDAEETGADEAAAGWGGDRYRFFRHEDTPTECAEDCRAHNALAIVWRGDNEAEALELRSAVGDFVKRSLEGVRAGGRTWELDGGWAAVGGSSDVVTLALAPTYSMAGRLALPAAQTE